MDIFKNYFFQAIQARKISFTVFQSEKAPFQAIKTRSSKSLKIDIFPKGLTHVFGPKMAIFPIFFQAILATKMSFTIHYSEKTPFQALKTRCSKSSKIVIFPTFFFQAIQAWKMSFTIFQSEKTPVLGIKTRSLKSQKIENFQRG